MTAKANRHAGHVAAQTKDDAIVGTRRQADSITSTQEAQAPRFKLFNADDALEPQPPIEWIVENLFSAGSVSLVVGVGGSKKTWSMLDCAVAVGLGTPWLNNPTQKRAVLIVDEESDERRLKRRLGDVMRGHSASKGDTRIECSSLAATNLLDAGDQQKLLEVIRQTGAQFILIDALIDTLIGGDENKSSDVQKCFRALRKIAELTQSAIVVIHHTGKNGGYRGSSAMQGAVDLLLAVESKQDSPNVDFNAEKSRDVEPFRLAAVANFDVESFNLSPSIPKEKQEHFSPSESYVLTRLGNGDATLADIEANTELCTSRAARQAVHKLVRRGKITRRNAGGRGVKAIYGLVESYQADAERLSSEVDEIFKPPTG